jgi:very-short-patch-repair endonuclease
VIDRKPDPKALFPKLCKAQKIPVPIAEHKFHVARKWRIDFAWPEYQVGLECDGGVFTQGRHTRGSGWLKDTEKLNAAAAMGWRMLRCTPDQLNTPEMFTVIRAALSTITPVRQP